MYKMRVGIIGVGNMGSQHLSRFVDGKIDNAVLTAVCDINKERVYRLKDRLGENVGYFENSNDLIHSGTIDGVIIATPHYDHPLISIEAFKAGLHVLCEKPAGVFTKNVREMNEAAKKADKAFQLDFIMRTNNAFKKIKELIDGNELGKIKRIVWIITDWYRTQAYYNSGGWRATWAGEGGGTLLNQNPHQLDLFQWLVGMPKRVRASCYFGKNRDIEVEDEATAYFEYENGAVGVYMTSVSEFPGTNRLEIAGDRGKIVYENNKITFFRSNVSEEEFNKTCENGFAKPEMWVCDIPFSDNSDNDAVAEMINNWVSGALKGEKLIAPGYEGINSLTLSNGIYLSQWTNDWVEFPIAEDEFYNCLQDKIKNSTFVKKEVNEKLLDIDRTFHK